MNDYFKEQLVIRKPNTMDTIKKVGIVVGGLVIIFATMYVQILAAFFMPIVLVVGFFVILLVRRFNIEFEYALTNKDLDIDKIYNKTKRKRLISIDVTNFEILVPLNNKGYEGELANFSKVIDCSSGTNDAQTYVGIVNSNDSRIKLIFEPNEKILKGIKQYIPRKVK